jgi:17beta-estradiol 17-dehydrogenase/3beta-hydroxysteroid 3-dehydrogenase
MGVIKGRKGVPISAASDDGTTPEVIDQFATLESGVTTDDGGASEIEPETDRTNDGSQSGRIRLFASRRSHLRRQNNLRTRHPAIPANTAPPPKVSTHGSKKFRRYENQLELLKECDENEAQEVSIEDLISGTNTARAFTKILKHSNMLELWNKYMEPVPEESGNGKSAKHSDGKGASSTRGTEFNADEAFQGICRNLRSLLKQRHFPLGMMESLEEDLIAFFMTRPQETFESSPMDAFRRGMIHAVSQYNSLRSHSVKCAEKANEKAKKVRVHPSEQPFSPPPVRLVEYIENKYHAPQKLMVLSK